jgi:hypothetical protein
MDRLTVEYGQLPLETDLLYAQRFAMVGLAKNAETILGTNTIVDGFTLTPTPPTASMALVLGPGVIYELENLEQTPWSSLPIDNHNIVKQGILLDAVTLSFAAPVTVGYATNCLVQVQYQDLDTGAVVRPYFDSANPAAPFEGPGNAGTADNTIRKGAVAYNVKVGSPAPSGTQATPTPDAGYAGLWVVTIPAGSTSLSAGNIAMYDFAPFLPVKLPKVPAGVQNCDWIGADDTGTTNALAAKIWPPVTSLKKYMTVKVKAAYTNTGNTTFNLNGLGAVSVVNKDASEIPAGAITAGAIVTLTYDGTHWQKFTADAPPAAPATTPDIALWHYGVANGADANNITVTTTPVPSSLFDGLQLCVKANKNTTDSNVTLNVNGLGARSVVLPSGAAPPISGMEAGHDYWLVFDGAVNKFRLQNPSETILSADLGPTVAKFGLPGFTTAANATEYVVPFSTLAGDNSLVSNNGGRLTIVRSGLYIIDYGVYSAVWNNGLGTGGGAVLLTSIHINGETFAVQLIQGGLSYFQQLNGTGCLVRWMAAGDTIELHAEIQTIGYIQAGFDYFGAYPAPMFGVVYGNDFLKSPSYLRLGLMRTL